jgi:oligopeptide/dipeptide ABC transporter ATP-binding protein
MRLIEAGGGEVAGNIFFHQKDLLLLSQSKMRQVRGNDIGMIFQEPMTSLNPVFSVGDQLAEVFRLHKKCSRQEAWKSAVAMLDLVRIPSAERRAHEFPHQLSGGMRQRVMIAMALACQPKLLIADEPTTALDVTIQAQILKLISELQQELGMAVLLITHDLGVVAETCDRVVVMYGGEVVETADVEDLFRNPQHPYTQGLLKSIPRLGQASERLYTIEGNVPSIGQFPSGCKFRTRCPKAFAKCEQHPERFATGDAEHTAACWLVGPSPARGASVGDPK